MTAEAKWCKYCKDIKELLNIGYDPGVKKVVSQIQYEGFYWSRNVKIPLNYCPHCGAKMHLQPIEEMTGDEWVDDVVESMKGETSHTIIPQEEMDALLSGLGDMYEPYKESEGKE